MLEAPIHIELGSDNPTGLILAAMHGDKKSFLPDYTNDLAASGQKSKVSNLYQL
jgi:hypothetical protein